MSKNFELLQRLSREQEIFDTGTELSAFPALEVAPPPLGDHHEETIPSPSPQRENATETLDPRPPRLPMEEKQRDEIVKFVQHVFMMQGVGGPRTVVLTSSEPGNGCSWICCRAAEILASQVSGSVCLVDANFRSPVLHQTFGVENHHGFSDALKGTNSIRNFIHPLDRENLWLLSCGSKAIRSHGLLITESLRRRLAELRQFFEYVLIDAPALSLGSDAMVLGRAAEGVVLVLKANASRRDSARNSIQDLQNAGAKVLGAVLNQRTFPIPHAIYKKF